MIIKKVRLKNFLSHEDSTINLDNRGLVLVEGENRDLGGSNGAGKTAIFDGILWCLFGITSRGVKGDEVCRRGSQGSLVLVEIKSGESDIVIVRHRKHSTAANLLRVAISGQDCSKGTDRETQAYINEILQLDATTFTNVVLFPQSSSGFASRTDAEQKAILERLLSLERFASAQERAKALKSSIDAKLTGLTNDIGSLEGRARDKRQTLLELKRKEESYETDKQRVINELSSSLRSHRDSMPRLSEGYDERIARLEAEIESVRGAGTDTLEQETREALQEASSKRASYIAAIQLYNGQLARFPGAVDVQAVAKRASVCPSCNQALQQEAIQALTASLQRQNEEQEKQKQEYKNKVEASTKGAIELEQTISKHRSTIAQIQELNAGVASIEQELNSLKYAKQQHLADLQVWQLTTKNLESQIHDTTTKSSPYNELLARCLNDLSELDLWLKDKRESFLSYQKDSEYFGFWVEGFGNKGIKSLLLDTVTPYLNTKANEYVRLLTNSNAKINFTTQIELKGGDKRDRFAVEVGYQSGADTYAGISGGERRRADIAVLFALADLASTRASSPVHLRLLDEPFDALDSLGHEQVVELLRTKVVPRSGTVLVMTHDDGLKEHFEHKILVIKENGISRVVDQAA